jgi:hypothetical protein
LELAFGLELELLAELVTVGVVAVVLAIGIGIMVAADPWFLRVWPEHWPVVIAAAITAAPVAYH